MRLHLLHPRRDWSSERGSQVVEYAIAAGLLLAAFVYGALVIRDSTTHRVEESSKVIEGMAPCDPNSGLASKSAECQWASH